MKSILRAIVRVSPFLYMGLIWYLSSHPSDAIIDTGLPFDGILKEALHLIEFAILYVLLVLCFLTFGKLTSKVNNIAAFWAIAYGFIDELHQYFVPSRTATIIDLVKDTIGVLAIFYLIKKYYFVNSEHKLSRFIHKMEKHLR